MSFEVNGKLIEKFDTQQVSEKFRKREFVLEVVDKNPQYTESVKFQLLQDKSDLLDNFNVGDEMTVHFNLKGRKWEKNGQTSYFTNLDAWRLEKVSAGGGDAGMNQEPPVDSYSAGDAPADDNDYSDDLPF